MPIYGNIKVIFILVFINSIFNTHSMEERLGKHSIIVHFNIRFALYCSIKNTYGVDFLEKLNIEKIEKESYFSFIQKPFQSNRNTGLLNPVLHEYDVEMQKFYTCKFNFYYGVYIACKGKVKIDGFNGDLNFDNTFLENAIIATIKENNIDTKFNDKNYRSYTTGARPSVKIPSLTDRLHDTIKKELTYVGNNQQRSDVHVSTLQRYFPSTLCILPEVPLGKSLYYILLNVKCGKDICGNLTARPSTYDPMAKIVCEKYDITVQQNKDN